MWWLINTELCSYPKTIVRIEVSNEWLLCQWWISWDKTLMSVCDLQICGTKQWAMPLRLLRKHIVSSAWWAHCVFLNRRRSKQWRIKWTNWSCNQTDLGDIPIYCRSTSDILMSSNIRHDVLQFARTGSLQLNGCSRFCRAVYTSLVISIISSYLMFFFIFDTSVYECVILPMGKIFENPPAGVIHFCSLLCLHLITWCLPFVLSF